MAATATGAVTAGSRYCATSRARPATTFSSARAHASTSTGILRRGKRLELGERRPLGVDRQPPAVGQQQTELDHLAAHPEIGDQHAGGQLGKVLTQDVLARPALRRAAGEDGGEPTDHVTMLGLDRPALLLTHGELVECSTRAIETRTKLLRRRGRGWPPRRRVAGVRPTGPRVATRAVQRRRGSVGSRRRAGPRRAGRPAAAPTIEATTAMTICAFTMSLLLGK